MKTNTIKIIAAGIVYGAILAGCSPEKTEPEVPDNGNEPVEVPDGKYELYATVGNMTKTVLDGLSLSWEDDDLIRVWTGEEFTDYVHQGNGKFVGGKEPVLKDGKYVALYPSATVNGTEAAFSIAQEQDFAIGKANDLPMVAVWGENEKCVFRPVCSILEMPLTIAPGVTLSTIGYDFGGGAGAGSYTYDWVSGQYSTAECGDVTLKGTFASGNVYNAVVPGAYNGFTLTLTDTDNCAMVLTQSKNCTLAAGSVQPLGAVSYQQLAPEFTIAYEDDWAATAKLVSTQGANTSWWLSKTKNGEPLAGTAPVDMGSMAKDATVKLYGYLCSENIAATGVRSNDKLYLVTSYTDGNVRYLRSVEYTYKPDPLEIVVCDDALISGAKIYQTCCSVAPALTSDNVYAGSKSFKWLLDQDWSGAGFQFDYPYVSFDSQEAEDYCFEFYMKPNKDIASNFRFYLRQALGNATFQAEQVNIANFVNGKKIKADRWNKVSLPMRQVWRTGTLTLNDYPDFRSVTGDNNLSNYKNTWRLFISISGFDSESVPSEVYIDYFTIRKSTL